MVYVTVTISYRSLKQGQIPLSNAMSESQATKCLPYSANIHRLFCFTSDMYLYFRRNIKDRIIGSAVLRNIILNTADFVRVIDKMTGADNS